MRLYQIGLQLETILKFEGNKKSKFKTLLISVIWATKNQKNACKIITSIDL